MKICVAQTKPVKGDVQSNIERHKKLIDLAATHGAEAVIFPELSITGYEPELARALATTADDRRFDDFQKISDARQLTVGVGVPIRSETGISIGMVLFQPRQARQIYSKKYLHADEAPFFVGGQSSAGLIGGEANVALAICYELSVSEHSADAFRSGAKIYLASVAKTAAGAQKASRRLSAIAKKYGMTVLMSNCVGPCDNFESAGTSAVWNDAGCLVAQLGNTREGIIVFDTETQEAVKELV